MVDGERALMQAMGACDERDVRQARRERVRVLGSRADPLARLLRQLIEVRARCVPAGGEREACVTRAICVRVR
jgi:hypothetical protein